MMMLSINWKTPKGSGLKILSRKMTFISLISASNGLLAGLSLALLITVTGCVLGTVLHPTNATNVPISPSNSKIGWLELSGDTQPAPAYYVVTPVEIKHVGKLISRTNLATNGPGGWSSSDNVVAVYTVPGRDTNKEVAAKLQSGSYVQADFVGNKNGRKQKTVNLRGDC